LILLRPPPRHVRTLALASHDAFFKGPPAFGWKPRLRAIKDCKGAVRGIVANRPLVQGFLDTLIGD
jgi:hypothetical protein